MSTWQESQASVETRLAAMSSGERQVFAAGVAERLMSRHEDLPEEDRAPFTLSLRPLLDSVWEGVLGDRAAFVAVKRGVAEFLLGDYCHNDGQDGPDEADESAAAATLYAAQAYLFGGCHDFAVWAGHRAVEAAEIHVEYLAEQEEDDVPDPDDAIADELRRQLRDLDVIAHHAKDLRLADSGLPAGTSVRLRAEVRARLSRRD